MAQQALGERSSVHTQSGIVVKEPADIEGVPASSYGADYNAHLLEQYKLYVQMADKISDRRQLANNFFLTLNTALVAGLAGLISQRPAWLPTIVDMAVCLSGLILCFTWHRMICSYRDLNSGKFKVIHEMEKRLPLRPYDAEWTMLGEGKLSQLYLPFSHIERWIPVGFGTLYLAMGIVVPFFRK
jgi:hypothetical protein